MITQEAIQDNVGISKATPYSEFSDRIKVKNIPFLGRLHIVRDREGYMALSFTTLYWIYGTFVNLFIILLPHYNDKQLPGELVLWFVFLSVMCIISLFKASTTNPGRVPLVEDSQIDINHWEVCKTCRQKRPKRAHHCRRCNQCVLRMDHHCPWINNCVGEENHWAFTLLLIYAFLLGLTGFVIDMLHFWWWPKCVTCDKESFFIKHQIWFVYLVTALGAAMGALMGGQVIVQHTNILLNQTTLETMGLNQSMGSHSHDSSKSNPAYAQYKDLCGDGTPFCWLFPFGSRRAAQKYINTV
ncbi:palmitoyltransferase ZDHHC21-like [Mytilus galloprovincialis]|uniref:palmitoyltransferase ZDHHC21-like n=1 Tax=Mytilus galloprovincialis TaxID=29158 RepID=UPI003F7CA5E3